MKFITIIIVVILAIWGIRKLKEIRKEAYYQDQRERERKYKEEQHRRMFEQLQEFKDSAEKNGDEASRQLYENYKIALLRVLANRSNDD